MYNYVADRFNILVLTILFTFIGAISGGTILWLIWEDSLVMMFPKIVSEGVISPTIDWWPSVKIVWIFSVLFKTVVETNKNFKQKTQNK